MGAFLVFDVNNRSSFENLNKTWHNLVRESCEHRVVMTLLGNKSDLHADKRQVHYNEGMEFAKKNGMNYLEVSAKTGKNVKNAFTMMTL